MAENDNNDDDGDHLQPLPAGRQGRDGLVYTLVYREEVARLPLKEFKWMDFFFLKSPKLTKMLLKGLFNIWNVVISNLYFVV